MLPKADRTPEPFPVSHPSRTHRRIVVVTRTSQLVRLLRRHESVNAAADYLRARGDSIKPLVEAHERVEHALDTISQDLAQDVRRTRVDRDDLQHFAFDGDDLILVVGQDGLVANVAKYLTGQPVLGVNPDPARYEGVLCQHPPAAVRDALRWIATGKGPFALQLRTMAQARREDGQTLLALNEIFVGHRTHQSALYRIAFDHKVTMHSSSGVVCATGTGATAWARAIARQRNLEDRLPAPDQPALAWFVREPFLGVATTAVFDSGIVTPQSKLVLESEMPEDGVAFSDGIESDALEFVRGHRITITIAPTKFALITTTMPPPPPYTPHRPSADFAETR
jgi:NAD kinase